MTVRPHHIRVSHKTKLLLMVTVTIISVIGVYTMLVADLQRRSLERFHGLIRDQASSSLKDEWHRKTRAMAQTVADLLVQPVYTLNIFETNNIVKSIQRQEVVLYILAVDRDGRVIGDGDWNSQRLGQTLENFSRGIRKIKHAWKRREDKVILEINAPILLGQQFLGTVVIGFPTHEIDTDTRKLDRGLDALLQDSLREILAKMMVYGVAILLTGSLAAWLVARSMTRPLLKLAEETRKIGRGDFDVKLRVESKDELGALNRSLILMSQELRQREESLKTAQLDLERKKEAAEAANKAKSEFLATMSHELRTPLNHIIGFTELVADRHFGPLNETQADYLQDVLQSSQHLLELINDVLDLSKVEAGKMMIVPTDLVLEEVLQGSLTMVREKSLRRGIRLDLDLSGAPSGIRADQRKFKQILYNLLANAVKFTPDGGRVSLAAAMIPSNNGAPPLLEVSVQDTGIGMAPEDLERVFKTFEQVESSAARQFDGTGLGLALSRSLVELHGGRIWAESEGPNRGSRFAFTLPVDADQGQHQMTGT